MLLTNCEQVCAQADHVGLTVQQPHGAHDGGARLIVLPERVQIGGEPTGAYYAVKLYVFEAGGAKFAFQLVGRVKV